MLVLNHDSYRVTGSDNLEDENENVVMESNEGKDDEDEKKDDGEKQGNNTESRHHQTVNS